MYCKYCGSKKEVFDLNTFDVKTGLREWELECRNMSCPDGQHNNYKAKKISLKEYDMVLYILSIILKIGFGIFLLAIILHNFKII